MEALGMLDNHNLVQYDILQPNYSLAHRVEIEQELAEVCRPNQIGAIPYSFLGGAP
jgi:aryl-alcohol dehydrogenase-like predicted oxidoreductase